MAKLSNGKDGDERNTEHQRWTDLGVRCLLFDLHDIVDICEMHMHQLLTSPFFLLSHIHNTGSIHASIPTIHYCKLSTSIAAKHMLSIILQETVLSIIQLRIIIVH